MLTDIYACTWGRAAALDAAARPLDRTRGARCKRRGFSPGAAARHSQNVRANTEYVQKDTISPFFLTTADPDLDPDPDPDPDPG